MKKIVAIMSALLILALATSALAATGLGVVTSVSVTAAGEKNGSVSVNTTVCALTLDENGVITGIKFDVVQPKAAFTAAGEVAGEATMAPDSKKVLKDGYGMRPASSIGAEWFEQAAAMEAWCIGKTVDEVLAMETYDKGDGHHTQVPVADIVTGCTIDVGEFKAALALAAADAQN